MGESEPVGADITRPEFGFCCDDAARRFWIKVTKTESCWLWHRPNSLGYGRFTTHKGERQRMAHRFAYEACVGPIPEGLVLDHLCRVRHCVNPAHLEPVTQRENTMRSPIAPAAINATRTHCVHGHEYTRENTIARIRPGGGRACKTCLREYMRRKRAEERAA